MIMISSILAAPPYTPYTPHTPSPPSLPSPCSIAHLPEPCLTAELCLAAVRADLDSIYFVPARCFTPELWEIAVTHLPFYFLSLAPPLLLTPSLLLAAVRSYPPCVDVLPESRLTPALCIEAVYRCGSSLRYLPMSHRTFNVCFVSAQRFKKANRYIPVHLKHAVSIHLKHLRTEYSDLWSCGVSVIYRRRPSDGLECCITYEPISDVYMECDVCRSVYLPPPLLAWLGENPTCPMCRSGWVRRLACIDRAPPLP